MCVRISIKDEKDDIETPRQFKKAFGILPIMADGEPITEDEMDCCLCHADIASSLKVAGVEFEMDETADFFCHK